MRICDVVTRVIDTKAITSVEYNGVCEILESYTFKQTVAVHEYINSLHIENKDNPIGLALIIDDPRILYTVDGLEAQLACMTSDGYHNDTLLPARLFFVGFDEDENPMLYSIEVTYKLVPLNKVVYSFTDAKMPRKLRQTAYRIL